VSRFVIREVRVGPDELHASVPVLGDTVDIRTAPDGGQVFIARLDAPLKYRIGDDFPSHRSPQPVIDDELGSFLWISAVAFRPAHPGQTPHYGMRAFPVDLAYVIDPAYVEDPHADPASIDIVGLVEIDDDDADAPNDATVRQAPGAEAQEVAPLSSVVEAGTPVRSTSGPVDEFDAPDPVPALDPCLGVPPADRESPISEVPQAPWATAATVADEPPIRADDTSLGIDEQFSGSDEDPAAAMPASPAVEEITPISLAGDIIDDDEVDTVDPVRAQDLYIADSQIEATGFDVPSGEAPSQSRRLADESANDEPANDEAPAAAPAADNRPTIYTGEEGTTNNDALTDEMAGRTPPVPAERPPGHQPTNPATSQYDADRISQGEGDDAADTPLPIAPLTDEMAQRTAPVRHHPATRESDAPQRVTAADQSQPDDQAVINPPPSAEGLDDTPPAGTPIDEMADRPSPVPVPVPTPSTAADAPRARVPAESKDAGSVEAEITEVVQRSHLAVPAAPPAAPRRSPDRGLPARGAFPQAPPPRPTGFTPRGGDVPPPGPAYPRRWPPPPTYHPAPAPMPARSGPGTPPPKTPSAADFQVADFQHRSRIRPAVLIAVGAVSVIVLAVVGYLLLSPSKGPDTSAAPTSSTKASDPERDQLVKLLPKGYPAGACKPNPSDTATVIVCTRNTDPGGPLAGTYSLHRDTAALDAALAKILHVTGQVNCPGNIQSPVAAQCRPRITGWHTVLRRSKRPNDHRVDQRGRSRAQRRAVRPSGRPDSRPAVCLVVDALLTSSSG
jgi:hypothetical protein